jgi:RNA polymerase sigma-70 factor (ECF subfamily)
VRGSIVIVNSEQELIAAAKKGSVEAFTALVGAHRERMLRFLLTRCSSYADAEDALQDTLMSAYRYLHSYNPRWRFSTWLYRIALRNAAKVTPSTSAELDELCSDEDGPLTQCIAASDRKNLWLAARRLLSNEVYSAMWLRYVEDMSVNDISAVLERSASWTKVNLLRGRKALDAELNRELTDDKTNEQESEAYG